MTDEKAYKIIKTSDRIYVDDAGNLINGKRIEVELIEFAEVHIVNVHSLDAAVVQPEVEELLSQRRLLAKWG